MKNFGCSTNIADGEVIAGCLAEAGYRLVETLDSADIVICNTCAVKGPTEDRMISILKSIPRDKKLIVAGCLPLINFERLCKEARFDGIVGPAPGEKIVQVVEKIVEGERVVALEDAQASKPSLNLPRIRRNPVISIIPISYGCNGVCAYCCVVHARGRLRSYSIDEIVSRVKADLASGAQEIWLTSQDAACYGMDIGKSLPELLRAVCAVEGFFKVRVGMMNPHMVLNMLDDLLEAFEDDKVFKFLHLPIQSGDDEILKNMRRPYLVADFKRIVQAFRTRFPRLTLATDVICGFPGEREEAFRNTLKLIADVKPDIVNISKFFARPRTPAAEMNGKVPPAEIKKRSCLLADLAKKIAFEKNLEWAGWTGEVLVDEAGVSQDSWVGRNFAYKPIAVKSDVGLLGRRLRVRITQAFSTYLGGHITEVL